MQTCTVTVEINMVVPWEDGNQFISGSSYTTVGIVPNDAKSQDTSSSMFTAALYNIHNIYTLEPSRYP